MCSSREKESPVREPIVWKGKPHFQRALFTGVILGVASYFAIPFIFYALTCLEGSPYPEAIPRFKDISDPFVVFIPVSAVFPALLSCNYLRHEYLMTRRHFFVRKGKKFDQYDLGLIRNTKVKKDLRASIFGISLEIHFASPPSLKGNAQFNPIRSGTSIRLEFIEDPYTVKSIIDLWAKSAKYSP